MAAEFAQPGTQQPYWYRGTTRNWPGGTGPRLLGRTSLTTDPLVATLFAIECARKGSAIVYLVPRASVSGFVTSANYLAHIEKEVVVDLLPKDLCHNHSVSVMRAYDILIELGCDLPIAMSGLDSLRLHLKSLNASQSYLCDELLCQFDSRALTTF